MEKISERAIVLFLSFFIFLFFYKSNITKEMIFYPLEASGFGQISFLNFGLGTLFLCILIAIISYKSLNEIDKIEQVIIAFVVFAFSFILIGQNEILYGFIISVCFGICFYFLLENIQKQKEQYRQINKMRGFLLVKSNIHKTFILMGFLCGFFVALMVLNTPNIEEKAINNIFDSPLNNSENIVEMANKMQIQTADAVNTMIINNIYNDDSLNNDEKRICIFAVNKSKKDVEKQITRFSQINSDNITITNKQNEKIDELNKIIKITKSYYFLIVGFIVFSIIGFYGSIVALFSALIGLLFYRQ